MNSIQWVTRRVRAHRGRWVSLQAPCVEPRERAHGLGQELPSRGVDLNLFRVFEAVMRHGGVA
jgi:hypothetical protein